VPGKVVDVLLAGVGFHFSEGSMVGTGSRIGHGMCTLPTSRVAEICVFFLVVPKLLLFTGVVGATEKPTSVTQYPLTPQEFTSLAAGFSPQGTLDSPP